MDEKAAIAQFMKGVFQDSRNIAQATSSGDMAPDFMQIKRALERDLQDPKLMLKLTASTPELLELQMRQRQYGADPQAAQVVQEQQPVQQIPQPAPVQFTPEPIYYQQPEPQTAIPIQSPIVQPMQQVASNGTIDYLLVEILRKLDRIEESISHGQKVTRKKRKPNQVSKRSTGGQ